MYHMGAQSPTRAGNNDLLQGKRSNMRVRNLLNGKTTQLQPATKGSRLAVTFNLFANLTRDFWNDIKLLQHYKQWSGCNFDN
jgi:hypothetical protein